MMDSFLSRFNLPALTRAFRSLAMRSTSMDVGSSFLFEGNFHNGVVGF